MWIFFAIKLLLTGWRKHFHFTRWTGITIFEVGKQHHCPSALIICGSEIIKLKMYQLFIKGDKFWSWKIQIITSTLWHRLLCQYVIKMIQYILFESTLEWRHRDFFVGTRLIIYGTCGAIHTKRTGLWMSEDYYYNFEKSYQNYYIDKKSSFMVLLRWLSITPHQKK